MDNPIATLQREMNRMFSDIWSSPTLSSPGSTQIDESKCYLYPNVDMYETKAQIQLLAELPGVAEEDIDLSLGPDSRTLLIQGEKKASEDNVGRPFGYAERLYGTFRRTLNLPSRVNPDNVKAKYRRGVLEIELQKAGPSARAAKRISIKSA